MVNIRQGFALGNARAAMWLSQLSYEDDASKIDSVRRQWQLVDAVQLGWSVTIGSSEPRTGGFIATGRDVFFIAFEGTDPLVVANWVTDFNFSSDSAGIHRGFRAALDEVWDTITAVIPQAGPNIRLIIAGHSLGGALAVICAERIAAEVNIIADGVYTFGMPRVGTATFAAKYNDILGDRTWRFVHGYDIVPTVPPTEFGVLHVGHYLAGP
jgi:predicted lipase